MKILCRCEDITEEEVLSAVEEGFCDLESLKRRLRLGVGPCQGRTCIPLVVRLLSRKLGVPPEELILPTARQPTVPVALGVLADIEVDEKKKDPNTEGKEGGI